MSCPCPFFSFNFGKDVFNFTGGGSGREESLVLFYPVFLHVVLVVVWRSADTLVIVQQVFWCLFFLCIFMYYVFYQSATVLMRFIPVIPVVYPPE